MLFTAFILDVIANTIYPARITIENGIFKEVTPITINESFSVDFPGLMMPHSLQELQCVMEPPLLCVILMK